MEYCEFNDHQNKPNDTCFYTNSPRFEKDECYDQRWNNAERKSFNRKIPWMLKHIFIISYNE
jgi:hypothetical protein